MSNSSGQSKYELRGQEKLGEISSVQRKKLFRQLGVIILGVAVLGLAGFGVSQLAAGSPSEPLLLASAISSADQTKGSPAAPVTLVEYSDFQCPACRGYYPIVKKVMEEFSGQVNFAYRHFPLPQHRYAVAAGRAAEAAGRQGKFWEMHDLIFDGQEEWSQSKNGEEIFKGYAASLSLDMEKFATDFGSEEIKDKVNDNYKSGLKNGVNSTPTFFLNGKQLQNPRSYEEFRNTILNVFVNP